MRRILRIVFFPFIWFNDHDDEILLFSIKLALGWMLFLVGLVVCLGLWFFTFGPFTP